MRITLDEWIKLQKSLNRQEIPLNGTATEIPSVVHIGVLDDDGMVEIKMRLIAETEWLKFQEIWKTISGINSSEECLSHRIPQFFLICR